MGSTIRYSELIRNSERYILFKVTIDCDISIFIDFKKNVLSEGNVKKSLYNETLMIDG